MFVVFEGGDGSGKSTQIETLASALRARGVSVVVTREPGGSPLLGKPLRDILLHTGGDLGPRAEALLFSADRAEHVRAVVEPALAAGSVVLCDRFVDSTLAYQGAGRGLTQEDLLMLSRFATAGRMPDLVVVCDVSPEVARSRQEARSVPDRMEKADMGLSVREFFLERAALDPDNYLVVDADLPVESVAASVWECVSGRLGLTT